MIAAKLTVWHRRYTAMDSIVPLGHICFAQLHAKGTFTPSLTPAKGLYGVAGTGHGWNHTNSDAYRRWFFVVHGHPRDLDVPAVLL